MVLETWQEVGSEVHQEAGLETGTPRVYLRQEPKD